VATARDPTAIKAATSSSSKRLTGNRRTISLDLTTDPLTKHEPHCYGLGLPGTGLRLAVGVAARLEPE
jgi:hypothetical protein